MDAMKSEIKSHVASQLNLQLRYDDELDRFKRYINKMKDSEDGTYFNVEYCYEMQFDAFALSPYVDSVKDETTLFHAKEALRFAKLHYALLPLPKNETMTMEYEGKIYNINAYNKPDFTLKESEWEDLLFLSIAVGDTDDLNDIMALYHEGRVKWCDIQACDDTIIYLHLLGLKPANDIQRAIESLVESINENRNFQNGKLRAYHGMTISLGAVDVMLKMHGGDEVQYRAAMYQAVEMHREWYAQNEMKDRQIGYLSLRLIAIARYAFNRFGYTLDFTSKYIPEWTQERDF